MAQIQKLVTSCQKDKCEKFGDHAVLDDLGARLGAWCKEHAQKPWAEAENEIRRAVAAQRKCAPNLVPVPKDHVPAEKAKKSLKERLSLGAE